VGAFVDDIAASIEGAPASNHFWLMNGIASA